jgi:hypothetical protein
VSKFEDIENRDVIDRRYPNSVGMRPVIEFEFTKNCLLMLLLIAPSSVGNVPSRLLDLRSKLWVMFTSLPNCVGIELEKPPMPSEPIFSPSRK